MTLAQGGTAPTPLLLSPVGVPETGAVRYAAAMTCYVQGQLSAEMLEIYRRCSKFDHEDPVDLARFEGIDLPPLLRSAKGAGS